MHLEEFIIQPLFTYGQTVLDTTNLAQLAALTSVTRFLLVSGSARGLVPCDNDEPDNYLLLEEKKGTRTVRVLFLALNLCPAGGNLRTVAKPIQPPLVCGLGQVNFCILGEFGRDLSETHYRVRIWHDIDTL